MWFDRLESRFDRIDRYLDRIECEPGPDPGGKTKSSLHLTLETDQVDDPTQDLKTLLREETPLSPKPDPSPAGMIAEFQALQRRTTAGFASVRSETAVGFGDIRREIAEGFEEQTKLLEEVLARLDRPEARGP